ncbi:sigma-54-dependent transcriptional regulator [Roseibacillus persicicus]|uniref:Acetoacetate metabolism regulatory protein AtoC n=1 Tax=Roseibacillus persicicus TaxID=454148 RepID=A0A918WMV0_9BACT|nr:response regulator [Roseibacillus persicicus]GHC64915.1 acetoacetate metabolism regulatory protein AtoC [Roseibacillus persicicus]
MSTRVLIVEDNRSLGLALASAVERVKLQPELVGSLTHAREELEKGEFGGILLDLGLPDGHGLSLLEDWRGGEMPLVAVVTAHGEIENAIEARKLGVVRFLTKPVAFDELEEFLGDIEEPQREPAETEHKTTALIGAAPAMQEVFQKTAHACLSREPLVIRGAAGTGRSHVATLIGNHSGGRLLWLHAAPEVESKEFERALSAEEGATLVIEDVAVLSKASQRELIRLLDEREVASLPRLIVTCDEEGLRGKVEEGTLEAELYYRLQVLEIFLPGLKERLGDLPALAYHFLGQIDSGGRLKFGGEVLEKLQGYDWPGNLRELRNVVSFCISARGGTGEVRVEDLPEYLQGGSGRIVAEASPLEECLDAWIEGLDLNSMTYQEIQGQVEGLLLGELLKRFDGKPSRMARELGINRSTLRKKLRELPGGRAE